MKVRICFHKEINPRCKHIDRRHSSVQGSARGSAHLWSCSFILNTELHQANAANVLLLFSAIVSLLLLLHLFFILLILLSQILKYGCDYQSNINCETGKHYKLCAALEQYTAVGTPPLNKAVSATKATAPRAGIQQWLNDQ